MVNSSLFVLLIFCLFCPWNVLTKENKTTSTDKLYCASCSYEYTFAQLQNQSNWQSPWSRCSNQTQLTSADFAATACHTLLRIDYARQYVTIYYNASYRSQEKLSDNNQRVVLETTLSTNGTQAQLKAFYECSFEDNCHLPLKQFLQLQTALGFIRFNYTKLIQQLNKFYKKPKKEMTTYFHADTLTSTVTGYCGDITLFDKLSLKIDQPKCSNKKNKLKSKSFEYNEELKTKVYTCNAQNNAICNNEKQLNQFLKQIIRFDYLQNFLGLE